MRCCETCQNYRLRPARRTGFFLDRWLSPSFAGSRTDQTAQRALSETPHARRHLKQPSSRKTASELACRGARLHTCSTLASPPCLAVGLIYCIDKQEIAVLSAACQAPHAACRHSRVRESIESTAYVQRAAMADAPSWQPLPPRRRKRQKSDTTTDTVSAFEQKAKANAEAVANVGPARRGQCERPPGGRGGHEEGHAR